MRETNILEPNVVTLLDAFNLIGRRLNGTDWIGNEAAAIRLGRRSRVDAEARERGLDATKTMRRFAENGSLNLIYTDHSGRRVPYFQNAGYWLTAIYPDPIGTGEGQIELDDRHLQPCVAEVTALRKWCAVRRVEARPGPKEKFGVFKAKCAEYFRSYPLKNANGDVRVFIKNGWLATDPWPSKSWGDELIEGARSDWLARVSTGI